MKKSETTPRPQVGTAIKDIRQAISQIDFACPGTLSKRWKQCGRPNCSCAHDPGKRHGPYYEWSRRVDGRLRHSLLTEEQATSVAQAIANHNHILALLGRWGAETARALCVGTRRK
jgi:hypothetical protein